MLPLATILLDPPTTFMAGAIIALLSTKLIRKSGAVEVWRSATLGAAWAVEGDLPGRTELKRADLDGAPGMEVITSVAEYRPGERIDLHTHHGIEAMYVVQGAQVRAPGKDTVALQTGASVTNLRDVRHGGITVVGDTSLKLFTVHIVDKDKPLYEYVN